MAEVKNNEARRATAIHEAGHAVVSYLLGRRIVHAVLLNEKDGETLTECSICDTSGDYYEEHDSKEDAHSKRIQDDLRYDTAIALAGAIAQRDICGDCNVNQSEFDRDIRRANRRAAHIHRGLDPPHCFLPWAQCQVCEAYLESMCKAVKQIIAKPLNKNSIEHLANKLETLRNLELLAGTEIEQLLEEKGLVKASEIGSLPPIAEPVKGLRAQFPGPLN